MASPDEKREGGSSGEFKARSFSEKSPLKMSSPTGLQLWDDDAPPAWIHGLEEETPKGPTEKVSPHAQRWKRSHFFFPALHWCFRTALGVTAATIFCFHTKISDTFDSFVFLLPIVTLFASDHSFGATVRNSANLVAGGVLRTFITLPFAMIAHQQHVVLKLLFLSALVLACSLVYRHHLLQKFGVVAIILTLLIEAPLRNDEEVYQFGDYLWFSVRLSISMALGCVFALLPFVVPGTSTFAASIIRARTLSLLVTCSEVMCELAESYSIITRPSNGTVCVSERAAVAECLGQCQIFLQLTEEEMKRLVLFLDDLSFEPVSWIVFTSESRNNSGDAALVLKSQFEYVQNILLQLQRSYAMVNDLFNQRYLKNSLSDQDIIVRAQPFIADSLLSLRPHLTAVAEKAEAQSNAGHSQAVPDVKFYQEGAEDHPLTLLFKAFESGRRSIFFEDASVHYSTQHHSFDLNHGITLHFFVYQVVSITINIERALQHYCSPLLLHAFKSKDPLDPDPVEVSGTTVARFFPIPRLQAAIRSTVAIVIVSCFTLIPALQHSSLHPFWAPMTFALIVDQSAVAGQLTKSLQRLQGIVLGPCFGYLIVSLFDQSRIAIAISVFVWIFFTTYSRSDLKVNPAWTVAGMGAVLTMVGVAPENSYQLIFDLLEQTVLGILIILILSVFLPEHNENELCRKIACLLQDARFCLTNLCEAGFHSSDCNLPNPPLSEKITKELLYGRLPRINRVLEMCHDLVVEIATDPRFWKPSFPKRSYREALSSIHEIQAWLSITISVMELGWTSASDSNLPPKCFVPMTFNIQPRGMQVLLQPSRSEIKAIETELMSVVDQLRESYQEQKRPQFHGYYSYRATPSLSGFLENLQRNIEYMYIGYRSQASEPLANRDVLVFYALIQCLLAISTHVEKLSLVSVGLFQQREVKYAKA